MDKNYYCYSLRLAGFLMQRGFVLLELRDDHKSNRKIYLFRKSYELIREWNSPTEASIELNINRNQISECCNGRQKTHKGFVWKYKIVPSDYVIK